eukprot:scaffold41725_cov59-Phaeocystis_antarctica.AAC.2
MLASCFDGLRACRHQDQHPRRRRRAGPPPQSSAWPSAARAPPQSPCWPRAQARLARSRARAPARPTAAPPPGTPRPRRSCGSSPPWRASGPSRHRQARRRPARPPPPRAAARAAVARGPRSRRRRRPRGSGSPAAPPAPRRDTMSGPPLPRCIAVTRRLGQTAVLAARRGQGKVPRDLKPRSELLAARVVVVVVAVPALAAPLRHRAPPLEQQRNVLGRRAAAHEVRGDAPNQLLRRDQLRPAQGRPHRGGCTVTARPASRCHRRPRPPRRVRLLPQLARRLHRQAPSLHRLLGQRDPPSLLRRFPLEPLLPPLLCLLPLPPRLLPPLLLPHRLLRIRLSRLLGRQPPHKLRVHHELVVAVVVPDRARAVGMHGHDDSRVPKGARRPQARGTEPTQDPRSLLEGAGWLHGHSRRVVRGRGRLLLLLLLLLLDAIVTSLLLHRRSLSRWSLLYSKGFHRRISDAKLALQPDNGSNHIIVW